MCIFPSFLVHKTLIVFKMPSPKREAHLSSFFRSSRWQCDVVGRMGWEPKSIGSLWSRFASPDAKGQMLMAQSFPYCLIQEETDAVAAGHHQKQAWRQEPWYEGHSKKLERVWVPDDIPEQPNLHQKLPTSGLLYIWEQETPICFSHKNYVMQYS